MKPQELQFDAGLLLPMYKEGPERIGFVLQTGEVIETQNICHDPENGFDYRGEDLLLYGDAAYASWHTHPEVNSNLSEEDRRSFLCYPHLTHFIIGTDGVTAYQVVKGSVVRGETYPFSREPARDLSRSRRRQHGDDRRSAEDGQPAAPRLSTSASDGISKSKGGRTRKSRKSSGGKRD